MNKLLKILCFSFSISSFPLLSADHIGMHVPEVQKVGEGRLKYLFWNVYDATLYTPKGIWQDEKPFALKLSYLLELEGEKIADRSIEEIRNQGFKNELILATWHNQMRKIFPDVDKGISITGIYTTQGESIFYRQNEEIGRIRDPEFGKAFFNIWLSEKTSEPELRKQLLGL
ncbi:MAG: chalcone isomerase family protein [Gammaproteobacteria bacterium]